MPSHSLIAVTRSVHFPIVVNPVVVLHCRGCAELQHSHTLEVAGGIVHIGCSAL